MRDSEGKFREDSNSNTHHRSSTYRREPAAPASTIFHSDQWQGDDRILIKILTEFQILRA